MSEPTPSKPNYWRRAIRPLVWWCIMVLLMFAYRTHERLSANTHINFDPTLAEKRLGYDAAATIDGKFANSGQHIAIGWHTLTITHPKTKSFSTNLFVWYGEHDLGQISLDRAMGTLIVSANPAAQRLTIQGPEFSVTLTNSSGMTSSVPTDRYVVEAAYKYWNRRDEVAVFADQNTVQNFAPKLGTLHIEASHQDVIYKLLTVDRQLLDAGKLPVTLYELPEGNYHLISTRKDDERGMEIEINASATNVATVEFLYGAAVLESDPLGASVASEGRDFGITPLTLSELKPGAWEFTLRLTDYESVTSSLTITVNQTNTFRTNLVSRFYTQGMTQGRRYFENKDYALAAEMSAEALKHKPGDGEGLRLQRNAIGFSYLTIAKAMWKRGEFADAIKQLKIVKDLIPENDDAKALLSDYTKREEDRIKVENKRQEELAEAERMRREQELAEQQARLNTSQINQTFNTLSRAYENSGAFNTHELTTSNVVGVIATAINNSLIGGQPVFQVVHYQWPRSNVFTIQARQRIGLGYRECLIVGGEVRSNETKIVFKVLEYDHPPDLNLFGGLLNVSGSINITSQDPKIAREKAERFQQRIKEGIEVVRKLIHGQNRLD